VQYIEPLQNAFDITAVQPRSHRFDTSAIRLPVRTLPCADYLNGLIPRQVGGLHIPNLQKVIGMEETLLGLDGFLPGFDLIHAAEQSFYCTYQIASRKQRYGYKLITMQAELNPFWFEKHPNVMRHAAFVRGATDLFIARTERAKLALVCEGVEPERVRVIGHGVDTTRFHPAPRSTDLCRRLGIDPDRFIILLVGRMVWEKGIFTLANAARSLMTDERFNALKPLFVIAGNGEERGSLQRRLNLLGVADCFKLIGNHPYNVLPDIHRLADIFVLPSISTRSVLEQFGIVLIEAMASGKPIVTTHCGAIDEVVGDAGVLVQPNDFFRLSEALRDLALDELRRGDLGARALARVNQLFRKEDISAKIARAYRDTLGHA
jgi:glycosyltransferase involved in cell wall biosynthesis